MPKKTDSEIKTPYAERIRAAMGMRNRSYADVSSAIGISKTSLTKILTGKVRSPGAEIIRALARELDVPVAFLMGETSDINYCRRM